MAKKFLTSIDLGKTGQLIGALLQFSAGTPSSPAEGQIWYDSTAKTFMFQNDAAARDLRARATHTGTQLASTISDFDTQVRTSRLDQMAAPTAAVAFGSQRLTGVADPTSATDGANKQYVDNSIAGLSWKDEVRAASTANVTIASALVNASTMDGVTLATGDRVLLKNQTAPAENGIYVVVASGAASRAPDADTGPEIKGAAVFVSEGTVAGGGRYVLSTTGAITLGSTSLTFVSFGGGSSYTAGNGLLLTGSVFSVVADAGILVSGTGVAIDTAVVVRKYATNVGDGSTTSIVVTHSLGTRDVEVTVYLNSGTYEEVEVDVQHTSTTTITLVFLTAPTSAQYRCVVHC